MKVLTPKNFSGKQDIVTFSWLVVLGLAGIGIILYTTHWGPIIFSDSVGYLSVARNLLSGNGLGLFDASGKFSPLTLQPPFFPIVLAFFGLSRLDLVVIARYLHALLFGLLVILIGIGFYGLTNSRRFALAGSLVVLVSPQLLYLFSLVMTEPVFILLSLLGALFLLLALKREHLGYLVVAAIIVGLSVITRLVGAAWIASGFGLILFFWRGSWKRRLQMTLGFGGLSLLPLGLWLAWNHFLVRTQMRQSVQLGGHLAQRFMEARLAFVSILWGWLPFSTYLPEIHYRIKLLSLAALAGVSFGLVLLLVYRQARKTSIDPWQLWQVHPISRTASLLWLSLLTYLGCIAAGYALMDPTPDLNERTLSMALVIGYGLAMVTCAAVYETLNRYPLRAWLPVILAGLLIANSLPPSLSMVDDIHREGSGYLSLRWRDSPTLAAAMQLEPEIPIISNEPGAIAFWIGRPVYQLPKLFNKIDPDPIEARFGDNQQDEVQRIFHDRGAALILFDTLRWQLEPIYFDKTPDRLVALTRGLTIFGNYRDGSIYFFPSHQP